MNELETEIKNDLHGYLLSICEVDQLLPQCSDVEERLESILTSYLPDGIREFNAYPTVSLGWMMYIGMAVARFWDKEWEVYSKIKDLYIYIRDQRGYDNMDDFIRQDVLSLSGEEASSLEKLIGECASRVYNRLVHKGIEPGTKDALQAYISCLSLLYRMGISVQLKRMGYHMTEL